MSTKRSGKIWSVEANLQNVLSYMTYLPAFDISVEDFDFLSFCFENKTSNICSFDGCDIMFRLSSCCFFQII